jgi:hypothetical protein
MKLEFGKQLRRRIYWTALVFAAIWIARPGQAFDLTTYDLRKDWSTNSNPNGVWMYRAGSDILPAYSWGDGFSFHQPSWQHPYQGSVPSWIFSTVDPVPGLDWKAGDVVVHTQDNNFGSGHGQANVVWTSPFNGTIRIEGGVWMCRVTERINTWKLYVRGNQISSGTVAAGDPYDRENPFLFHLGSGGSNVLENIAVSVGDEVMLEVVRNSVYGDYVGVNLSVTRHVSDPSLISRAACVELCFNTSSEAYYQLQYSTSLNTNLWTPVSGFFQGNGSSLCTNLMIPAGELNRFYRVWIKNALPEP